MNKIHAKGHRELRKGRKSIPGTYYTITLATYKRTPILTIQDIPNIIYDTFDWLENDKQLKWMCIMVMPDHIHAVFQLGNKKTLSELVQSFRRFTANKINKRLRRTRTGAIWQANFYDHGIRQEESLNEIIRYCYENPVRKNLVVRAEDYPHWRCKFQMQQTGVPISES